MMQAVFFVGALVLLMVNRKLLMARDPSGYRKIAAGVVVFALVSVADIWGKANLFAGVPFLSDPVFFRLLAWLGIISGVILTVGGMASWLPLSHRSNQLTERRLKRLELLRKTERLLAVEHRESVLVEALLRYAAEAFEPAAAAAFTMEPASDTSRLVAVYGRETSLCRQVAEITLRRTMWLNLSRSGGRDRTMFTEENEHSPGPPDRIMTVPMSSCPEYLLAFWMSPKTSLDDEDAQALHLAINAIERALVTSRLKNQYHASEKKLTLWKQTVQKNDIATALSKWVMGVRQWLPLTGVTVVLVDASRESARRYRLGQGDRVLSEKAVDLSSYNLPYEKLLSTEETIHQLSGDVAQTAQSLLNPNQAAVSSFSYIIRAQRPYFGLVSLETSEPLSPGAEDILSPIQPVLQQEVQHWRQSHAEELRNRFNRMMHDCLEAADIDTALAIVSRYLKSRFRADAVRIATLSGDGFLQSRSLTSESREAVVPARGMQVLSLMPNHQRVLKLSRPLFLSRMATATSAPDAEWRQMFSDQAKAALLTPVIRRGRTWGMLTLVCCDQTKIPSLQQVAASGDLRPVASLLALLLTRRSATMPDRDNYPEVMLVPTPSRKGDSELRSHVRSSLAGIVASAEALRTIDNTDTERLERYLSVIDRSADRIKRYLEAPSLSD